MVDHPAASAFSSTSGENGGGLDGATGQAVFPLRSDEHVVALRKLVRDRSTEIGLSLVDQTKLVTASSEIARNTLKYGGGGEVSAVSLTDGLRRGIRLTFSDKGAGIPDIAQALTDGFTTGAGLGLGLGGAKRLVDEFEIKSAPGEGTMVTLVKWKR
jgi:serine/threonine-protein kinase RsbT